MTRKNLVQARPPDISAPNSWFVALPETWIHNPDLGFQKNGNGLHFISDSRRMIPELRRNRH
jgi:hypothetical protein